MFYVLVETYKKYFIKYNILYKPICAYALCILFFKLKNIYQYIKAS